MTMNQTDLIKDKLNILDVVRSYVTLKQTGKTWKGKSPFTNEKTPSFFVVPEKGFFYCFSSGKGGDIFTFIQEIERVDFKEALKILADKAGVELTYNASETSEHDTLYKLLDDTTKWYEVNLRKNKEVVSYLLERGVTKETMVRFRLGFALDSWDDLHTYLSTKGYTDTQIERAGLSLPRKKGSGYYNRFRSRIMFPIMDTRGRVVGFSGRIFGEVEEQAKYINSPEGPLFDKSRVLYGYHLAKTAMAKEQKCIIVEGQVDVVMAHQAGFEHAVAVSGTGLTDEHINMIQRFATTALLSFDSDKAGVKATRRSVLKAYEHGLSVKIIPLPFGKDPADMIKENVSRWEVCVADAKDYFSYRLDIFDEQHPDADFQERHQLITEELFPFIYLMQSSVLKDKTLQRLAQFIGVSIEALRSDFESYQPDEEVKSVSTQIPEQRETSRNNTHSFKEDILGITIYLDQTFPKKWKKVSEEFEQQFLDCYGTSRDDALQTIEGTTREMMVFKYTEDFKEKNFEQVYERIQTDLNHEIIRSLEQESKTFDERIREAEHHNNEQQLSDLLREQHMLRVRIDRLRNE